QNFEWRKAMNCLIKHSQSFVIESLVKRLIADINIYSHLLTTVDWQLLISLNNAVGERQNCQKNCLGCLEFSSMLHILSTFIHGVSSANKKSEAIVTELCRIFTVPNDLDPVVLALDLVVSPNYVKSKISAEYILLYEKYVDAVKSNISRLALDHFLPEQAKCNDTILAHVNLDQEQV